MKNGSLQKIGGVKVIICNDFLSLENNKREVCHDRKT
jgi:hypothetical protein